MFNDLAKSQEFTRPPGKPYAASVFGMPDAASVRLDERLAGAPESVRAGWVSRALVYEASASLRLDGLYVSAHDLLLRLNNTLDRAPDQDIQRAKDIHAMLSTLMRRNPRHLFNPDRIVALTRLRLHNRAVDHPDLPDWLQGNMHSPEDMREALEDALQPSTVSKRFAHVFGRMH